MTTTSDLFPYRLEKKIAAAKQANECVSNLHWFQCGVGYSFKTHFNSLCVIKLQIVTSSGLRKYTKRLRTAVMFWFSKRCENLFFSSLRPVPDSEYFLFFVLDRHIRNAKYSKLKNVTFPLKKKKIYIYQAA